MEEGEPNMDMTKLLEQVDENYKAGRDSQNIQVLASHREILSQEMLSLLARAYNNNGEEAKALEIFRELEASGYSLKAVDYYRMAYAEYYLDQEEVALAHVDLAMELDQEDELLEFTRGLKDEIQRYLASNEEDQRPQEISAAEDMGICFDIPWTFGQKTYTDEHDFFEAVKEYLEDIGVSTEGWKKDRIAIDAPRIYIQYEAWVKGEDDLLPNESLVDEEEFDEEYAEDGMFQVEIYAFLEGENGQNFTAVELLMKTHNQQANKELGDHIYFEGLDKFGEENGIPVYFVSCGS
jgi:hypothetical protein